MVLGGFPTASSIDTPKRNEAFVWALHAFCVIVIVYSASVPVSSPRFWWACAPSFVAAVVTEVLLCARFHQVLTFFSFCWGVVLFLEGGLIIYGLVAVKRIVKSAYCSSEPSGDLHACRYDRRVLVTTIHLAIVLALNYIVGIPLIALLYLRFTRVKAVVEPIEVIGIYPSIARIVPQPIAMQTSLASLASSHTRVTDTNQSDISFQIDATRNNNPLSFTGVRTLGTATNVSSNVSSNMDSSRFKREDFDGDLVTTQAFAAAIQREIAESGLIKEEGKKAGKTIRTSSGKTWKVGTKIIGTGSQGRVFVGLGDDGKAVAIKTLPFPIPEHGEVESLRKLRSTCRRELEMIQALEHPNIVKYYDFFQRGDLLYLVMEKLSMGSVGSLLNEFGPLEPKLVSKYTRDLLEALRYVHEKRILHRDVKPANIMLGDDGNAKLGDFGVSKRIGVCSSFTTSQFVGSPVFLSPEVTRGEVATTAADIWSVGVTVFNLLTDRFPFPKAALMSSSTIVLYLADLDGITYNIPEVGLPDEAMEFVRLCLHIKPQDRPSCEALLTTEFINKYRESEPTVYPRVIHERHPVLVPVSL